MNGFVDFLMDNSVNILLGVGVSLLVAGLAYYWYNRSKQEGEF